MNKVKEILLIGGGGHCRSCIDVIETLPDFKIVGIVDTAKKVGQQILSYPVIGTDADLGDLRLKYDFALLTIGHVNNSDLRQKLFTKLVKLNYILPPIVSKMAYVSPYASLGFGTIVMHHAFVNAGVRIGDNVIINTKALIEHDSLIVNHCHVSTNASINGDVNINHNVFIGSNACVLQGLKISSNITIGANSTVLKNLVNSGTYIGSPCKKI